MSHVCSTDKSNWKELIVNKSLSRICSTDEDESEGFIVNECFTEEDKSECVHKNINKQKDVNIEAEYEKYSVTDEVPIYFNIFECGRNLFNKIDMTYDRACMYTPKDIYFDNILETLVNHNNRHNAPFSNENLRQAISIVVSETEDEERNAKCNANNMNMDNLCQSPVTANTQRKNTNITIERQIYLDILAERIKGLKGLKLQSTINNSAHIIIQTKMTQKAIKKRSVGSYSH